MDKIDFVIIWVDGSDNEWEKVKNNYNPDKSCDAKTSRYRDWDNLQYWFRGVEKFAPWVNKIHFVTYGHLPKWLNIQHPKLNIVNHKDYIPDKYLPTFSANPIELNLHRINGLSEQFVYFNDDMFLLDIVSPDDFFYNNLPCDSVIEDVIISDNAKNPFNHILLNDISIINNNFHKHKVIKKQFTKWFNLRYGKGVIKNLLLYPWNSYSSFQYLHLPSPFLKSTLEEVWSKEPEILEATSSNKFRSPQDVNQYLFKYWQYVTGNFHPISQKQGKSFIIGEQDRELSETIRNQKFKMICINDNCDEIDFDSEKQTINSCFESILPEKSKFEL